MDIYMDNKRVVLICDNDADNLAQMQTDLQQHGYTVETLPNAGALVDTVQKRRPMVLVVNPDMDGFNAAAVCNNLQKELGTRIILLLEPNSTQRAQIDACEPDEVVTKPVQINNLANLIANHINLQQQ